MKKILIIVFIIAVLIYFGGRNYNEIRSYFGPSSKVELNQEFSPETYKKYYFDENSYFQITKWETVYGGIMGVQDMFEYKMYISGNQYYGYSGYPVIYENQEKHLYDISTYFMGGKLSWVKIIKN